ncbi:hypothetical protein [Sedimenticola selenatireducens]|uniref:hypothetical protein n=1 Tax=Sedimenticola selenatireducens TaxID=191960 RepID=UPI00048C1985|nr:hypothetical protein [Sedimenticola selenatireducens]
MELKRRRFLQGMLAGGGALASGGLFSAMAAALDVSPVSASARQLWLKNGAPREAEFAQGLAMANPDGLTRLSLSRAELYRPTHLQHLLATYSGQQLVGMMEQGAFELLHELVRSAGGRVLYTGQHRWGGGAHDRPRHAIATTPQTQRLGNILYRNLRVLGEHVLLNQLHATGSMASLSGTRGPSMPHGSWPELVGAALGNVGASAGRPYPVEKKPHMQLVADATPGGSLVSFMFEV